MLLQCHDTEGITQQLQEVSVTYEEVQSLLLLTPVTSNRQRMLSLVAFQTL